MKNYIILENRPELTTAQVLGGMNFGAVKAGALASTTVIAGVIITKGLITKLFIAALVFSSAFWVYNKDNEKYEEEQVSITKAMTEPNHYGEKRVMLEETAELVKTAIKPVRIIIPTIAPIEKVKEPLPEPKNEITSNAAVPSLTSPTNVLQTLIIPTVTLLNPGPAVCQPASNNHGNPFTKMPKDSVK